MSLAETIAALFAEGAQASKADARAAFTTLRAMLSAGEVRAAEPDASAPLRVLLVTLAGWINRHRQDGDRVLARGEPRPEGAGEGAPPPADRRPASTPRGEGRRLGRRALRQVATIVTPDTILRWHRQLIAQGGRETKTLKPIGHSGTGESRSRRTTGGRSACSGSRFVADHQRARDSGQ